MTEEDIKQKAEEYAHNNYEILVDTDNAFVTSETYLEQGYLAGAEPREKCIEELEKGNTELKNEIRKLKILVSSLVYEINQIWDINEMNDDLRMCAEKIDREVQLSKMAEDNRMVISALGFAIVPPKPKLDVKEV